MPPPAPICEHPDFIPLQEGELLTPELVERLRTMLDVQGFEEMYWHSIGEQRETQAA